MSKDRSFSDRYRGMVYYCLYLYGQAYRSGHGLVSNEIVLLTHLDK